MKLKLMKNTPSARILRFEDGAEVLFSYETPVAGRNSGGPFRTEQYYSNTTSRHINTYLSEYCHVTPQSTRQVPQAAIDLMLLFRENQDPPADAGLDRE